MSRPWSVTKTALQRRLFVSRTWTVKKTLWPSNPRRKRVHWTAKSLWMQMHLDTRAGLLLFPVLNEGDPSHKYVMFQGNSRVNHFRATLKVKRGGWTSNKSFMAGSELQGRRAIRHQRVPLTPPDALISSREANVFLSKHTFSGLYFRFAPFDAWEHQKKDGPGALMDVFVLLLIILVALITFHKKVFYFLSSHFREKQLNLREVVSVSKVRLVKNHQNL